MTDLPHTYTDVDVDGLAVFRADIPGHGRGVNVRTDPNGCSVPAEDAPALARAVLAAAGDAGHQVITEEAWDAMIGDVELDAAQSMRERAAAEVAAWIDGRPDIVGAIRALPLLPDEGETEGPYRVVHQADLLGAETAVIAMRQRAATLAEYSGGSPAEVADAIRALPLQPDGGDEVAHSGVSLEASGTPSEQPDGDADLHARVTALEAELRQAQAAIRGLASGRTAPGADTP